jgi:hypothetical protein
MLYFQKGKLLSDYDYIAEGNKNFLANWKLTDRVMSLNEKNNIKYFFSNCIYGNIEHFDYEKQKIQIILISRRYLWNFGLFNYRRGLSKYGGNSNQIETELILIYDNSEIFSNIHLSSYLPIYFKEKKNKEINEANKAFIKYIKTLIDEYNVLFLFALKKDEQEKYINKFKNMLTKNKNSLDDRWKYFCINTKEKTFKMFLSEMKKKKDLVEFIGFNHLKNILFDKDMTQIGIFSLLSIDDKLLNQNQFYLVYDTIYHILSHLNNTNKIPLFLEEDIDINADLFVENNDENENKIIEKENEDFIIFIDKLKNIFKKRMNELTKQYYLNCDDDLCKKYQRIYEILFGKNLKYSPLKDNLKYLKEEFSDLNTLKIFVGSWNTGCTDINKNKNLSLESWLLPKDTNLIPDIYFIGFQEVVELNTTNLIMLSEEKQQQILDEWDLRINLSIQKIGKYKKLVEMNLVGINFYCYVLENKFDKITNLSKKKVKTGLGGATGNKGSCCINFEYENTSFSVACSHLAAGANKNKQRLKELNYVLDLKLDSFYNPEKLENVIKEQFEVDDDEKSYEEVMPNSDEDNKLLISQTLLMSSSPNINQNANNNSEANDDFISFKDSDIWIMFGDLNFRVDMEYEEFSEFIKKGNSWNKLIDYDQFTKFKLASLNFMEWIQEDEIKFPPTYKYITNSNEYDYTPKEKNNIDKKKKEKNQNEQQKSGKKRNPSWCDRVFYKKNAYVTKNGKKIINGIEYNNVMNENFMTSDHRPVYQIFDVIVFKEDDDKKNIIEKEILLNEKLGISSKYMRKKTYDY